MEFDSTYGVASVGQVLAAVLYGVSCVQAFYYYTTQNDPWYTKQLVALVMVLDTVHQALITHAVYTYTVTDWGNQAHLFRIVWSIVVEVLFTGITAFIVQSFLTMRIWRLSNRNIYLTGISAILVVASFAIILVNFAFVFRYKNLVELANMKTITVAFALLMAITDVVIAGILCTLLHSSRTGFHKSEVIINKLIVFTVNTGLLTSLCALACLISLVAAGNTFLYIAFFFCLGRLYTNTLLATLNARNILRTKADGPGSMDGSLPLRDFSKHVSSQINCQPQQVSITIDTTTQSYQAHKLEEKTRD